MLLRMQLIVGELEDAKTQNFPSSRRGGDLFLLKNLFIPLVALLT
jgi:hypothetical protein